MIKDIFSNCMTVFSQTRDDENLKTIQQIIKSASEYKKTYKHLKKTIQSVEDFKWDKILCMLFAFFIHLV